MEVQKPEVEKKGWVGKWERECGSEKGRNEAELEMESNPPPDTTAPAPGDSKAASHSAADSPTASINASDYQTSYQPSLALLPPSVLNDPFPRAVDSKSEWLLPSPAEEV